MRTLLASAAEEDDRFEVFAAEEVEEMLCPVDFGVEHVIELFRGEDEGVDDAVQPLAQCGEPFAHARAILDVADDE